MKVQVVGIDRLKLYREKKDAKEPDPPIVEPPRQESLDYPDDEFLLDWKDGAEGVEDPDMPYYLGGGGGGEQSPPPPPPPPNPQGGGGGVPAQAPVEGGPNDGGEAAGWTPSAMRDNRGHVVYDQAGRVRYLPRNGPRDGPTKKKKRPPPGQPDSPQSPTTPMATSTPATRRSNRTRTIPPHLYDYVHGADLNSDSLGLLPLTDYNQSDLSDLLNNSSQHIQERIQIQEEEMRAQDAREQARIQKRLARGPRDLSPHED
jgi:hypothetical protein